MQDPLNVTIYDRQFTRNIVTPALSLTSGRLVFENNNRLCSQADMYNTSKFIAGQTCSSQRLISQFNSQTSATALTGMLRSSMVNMTFELWFKDQTVANSSGTEVFLENLDGRSTLIQISLVPVT